METNFSIIKSRIIQFAEYKRFSKRKIYLDTGISNGVLDKPTGLTEDNIEKFISTYPEVNVNWLMTGEGNMLKDQYQGPEHVHVVKEPEAPYGKDAMIRALERENELLREMLEIMKKKE